MTKNFDLCFRVAFPKREMFDWGTDRFTINPWLNWFKVFWKLANQRTQFSKQTHWLVNNKPGIQNTCYNSMMKPVERNDSLKKTSERWSTELTLNILFDLLQQLKGSSLYTVCIELSENRYHFNTRPYKIGQSISFSLSQSFSSAVTSQSLQKFTTKLNFFLVVVSRQTNQSVHCNLYW